MSKWDFIELSELCDLEKGKTGLLKAKEGEYTLVATGKDRRTCDTYQFDTKAVCVPLVSSTGHGHASLKYVHYQEGKFALGTILVAVVPKDENVLNAQFLHLYLSRLKDVVLVPLMTGAANVTLTVTKLKTVKVPLPPIEEQLRIVALFNSMDNEQAELTDEILYQQELLKKLRQSVLQEAIEGKLTTFWREQNPDVEPTSVLIERIQNAQGEWVIREKEKGNREASTFERKLNKLKQNPLLKPSVSLPKYWSWSSIIEISNIVVDCHNKTAPYTDSGVWIIRTTNIRNGLLNNNEQKFVHENTYKYWSRRCPPEPGDIVYTREAPIGEVTVIPENTKICMGQRMMLIRPFHNLILKEYLKIALMEPSFLKRLEGVQIGATVKHLRVGDVENAMIPIPPLEEQKEIVQKIENLLQICDGLETQINSSKMNSETLMQAVLKEAFEK